MPAGASVMEKTRQQHSTSLVVVASEAQRRKDTHRLKEEEERYIVVDILRSSQVVALVDGTEKKAGAALIESNRSSSSSSSCPLVSEGGEREKIFLFLNKTQNRREKCKREKKRTRVHIDAFHSPHSLTRAQKTKRIPEESEE